MFYCCRVTSHWCKNMTKSMNSSDPSGRSPHFPFSLLFTFTSATPWLRDPWPLLICQKSGIIACFRGGSVNRRSQEPPEERLDNDGKFKASSESSVFMFVLTATVGRNLFCLDQCDTLSSSHRSRCSHELDKEWNISTNVCPATSYSVWTVVTSLICFVTQDH